MDITIGTLQLNRTNPAHMGTKPLQPIASGKTYWMDNVGNSWTQSPKQPVERGAFESYLMDAMATMNQQQIDVENIQEKVITDPDSLDIHDVTTAMAKAQMSLNLAQTVIDRLVSGWNELSTTR